MKRILGACLQNCVHVAGIINYMRLAEREGYETIFLGAAVSLDEIIKVINEENPDIVGLSYRLTPEVLERILNQLMLHIQNNEKLLKIKWLFGGTELTVQVANKFNIFSKTFDGTDTVDKVISYLRGNEYQSPTEIYPQTLVERIESKYPYPVLRHHFGLPSMEQTISGVKQIAQSKILDIISLAPDQNAQQFFLNPGKMNKSLDGAGGTPFRNSQQFKDIFNATRTGNYPLLRCYSGTRNIMEFAEMLVDTINNAWCAVPLCWYNKLDGRSNRDVTVSIHENQSLMKWHAQNDIPIEVNEAHHWSLRDAHDTIGVVTAYLAAYNAKKMGVKNYIAQYMFNVPPTMSPKMDIAKMQAKIELIEELEDINFHVYRQARAGLASFPADLEIAKGQLASSTYTAMHIKPHILHVVGFCEAHHAATPEDIIESCKIVRGVINNCILGLPDVKSDKTIENRKNVLIKESQLIINSIKENYCHINDPLSSPIVIADAIKTGLLDAPHLKGNISACGRLETRIIDGACYAYDYSNKKIISEEERIEKCNSEKSSSIAK